MYRLHSLVGSEPLRLLHSVEGFKLCIALINFQDL